MFKKLAVLATALALSAPAFADRGHRDYRHGHRVIVHKPVVHHYRPVVHRYHRPAPQPVVVVHQSRVNPGALIFGAMLGAVIVHAATSAHY